jgi:hypothetical protein
VLANLVNWVREDLFPRVRKMSVILVAGRGMKLVGALCFSGGKQRFSVAEKSSTSILRFSAGHEIQG